MGLLNKEGKVKKEYDEKIGELVKPIRQFFNDLPVENPEDLYVYFVEIESEIKIAFLMAKVRYMLAQRKQNENNSF
jgi:hypothetical protein